MSPELNVSLNLAQLFLLGGLIWGLARMKSSVDMLTTTSEKLTNGLERVASMLAELGSRVSVLEDRGERE